MTHPFTDQYIAMVKDAEEIQAMRPKGVDNPGYLEGDAVIADGRVSFVGEITPVDYYPTRLAMAEDSGEPVFPSAWLPRLDQLLGMLGNQGAPDWFAGRTIAFPDDWGGLAVVKHPYSQFTDWHELAIAVVMREKHGKTWEDGKWVK